MARKRMIDPSFWIDEKLGTMSPIVRLLFMGLISNSDDEGRLVGHPALVKSIVFPYDIDVSIQQVEEYLQQIHEKGLIQIYSVNNQTYIQVNKFKKYQKINRPTPSQLPSAEQLTEYSLNSNGTLIDNSLPIEEKRREENRIKENRREGENSLSLVKEIEIVSSGKWNLGRYIEQLNVLIEMHSYSWVKEALLKAISSNKLSLSYAEGILKNWQREGKEESYGSSRQDIKTNKFEGFKPPEPKTYEGEIDYSDII